ncbi:coiled-coil domain-containing protein 92 [Galendromus occidentalis]|uniref:Coiled-coil domain-containing protein 92 n=1 Tax=Galendromus occidentalis TaxID=34638 RepID=A0AAJ6VX17_9ACAR|nr:coiled-coil domain-containing protein 92 [Galendromus occidentalis]
MTTIEDNSDPGTDTDSDSSQDVPDSSTCTKNSRPKKLKKASELLDESSLRESTDDEVLADMVIALQVKLHSARSDLVFVQGKQKMLLRSLHSEMEKLQRTVRELQFAIVTKGLSYIDEDTYKARVAQLEARIADWSMRCNYLNAQLNVANDSLVELNERVQLQEFEHEDIVRQRDEIIAVLKRQLEMKSIEVEVLRQITASVSPIDETHPPLKRAHSDVSRSATDACRILPPQPSTPQHRRRKVLRMPGLVSRMLSPHRRKQRPSSNGSVSISSPQLSPSRTCLSSWGTPSEKGGD